MKVLIDENLPKKLKLEIEDNESYTVRDMGWQSKSNGELVELMLSNNFKVLVTFDQNLQYQQNLKKYPISIIVVNTQNNQYDTIKAYRENLNLLITNIQPGEIKPLC